MDDNENAYKPTKEQRLEMAKSHLRAAKAGGCPLDQIMMLTEQIRSIEMEAAPAAPDLKRRLEPVAL